MRSFRLFALLAAFYCVIPVLPVHGQTFEPDEEEIIVPGERPMDPKEVKQQARQITADRSLWLQPLARFEEPVCPGVIGLPFDLASPLILRIRAVADAIGIETADPSNCKLNVIVAFTGDGKADLAELAERDISLISGLSFWERKRLLAEDGPTRAFSMVGIASNSGMPSIGNPPVVTTTMASRLIKSSRRDIEIAVVLIDADAADGKTVTQLADYAAMRTFARTRHPKGDVAYGTILQLFEEIDPLPEGLTLFDTSYLRAIYEGPAARAGNTKLKRVSREMNEANGGEKP